MTVRHFILALVLISVLSVQASAAPVQVIVQLSPIAPLNAILSLLNGTVLDSIPGSNIYLLQVPSLPIVSGLLRLLGLQWLEPNTGVLQPAMGQLGILGSANPDPEWYKNQPAMQLTHSQNALTYATGRGVVIADINSQVDYSHPALRGHLTSGWDFITGRPASSATLNQSSSDFLDQSSSDFLDQSSSDFLDQSASDFLDGTPFAAENPAYSHGTLCAGVIAVTAPDSMIMPLRAFDSNGGSDAFTLTKAIRYAVQNGAEVINMSFGTLTDSQSIHSAINYAIQSNVILVASSGNDNTSAPQYPAAYAGVMAVSATDDFDVKAKFSNFGPMVAVDGPGVNIISAYPGGYYSVVSGTSFSAPMVAGTAALIRSLRMNNITPSILSGTVNINAQNPSYSGQLGSGRIDVLKAVHP